MNIHIMINGQEKGPFSQDEILVKLAQGEIKPSDMAWKEGLAAWEPLQNIVPMPKPQAVPVAPMTPPPAPPPNASAPLPSPASGSDFISPRSEPPASPHWCWINILYTGLAQVIFGQTLKGLVHLVAMTILYILTAAVCEVLFGILGTWFVWFILWIISAAVTTIDAFMVGKALSYGLKVGKWQYFPRV